MLVCSGADPGGGAGNQDPPFFLDSKPSKRVENVVRMHVNTHVSVPILYIYLLLLLFPKSWICSTTYTLRTL